MASEHSASTLHHRARAGEGNGMLANSPHYVSDKRQIVGKTDSFIYSKAVSLVSLKNAGNLAMAMKTQGEIEAAICEGMARFQQEYMGRGPKDIRAHLIGDLLLVRLQGVLTAAEQHLVTTLSPEKGRDLLKQVRSQLIEIARPALETLVQDITGVKPRSLHHDISTLTGEEVVIFTLAETPQFRELKKK